MGNRATQAQIRGLGSAKEGVAHWWAQRLTAVALVPLTLWFVVSVIMLAGSGYGAVYHWLGSPFVAVLMILLIGAGFHHTQLGVQVIIEDYVHTGWLKITCVALVKFAAVVLALASAFAVLMIAFGE
ncbi:MAG: succinate dehydrogenase, hydrophobic membrane anchor protein [Alphaproteobacteria bacterium]